MPKIYAIDFETSYSSGRDISSLGVFPYLEHPKTDVYLVSIYGEDVSYVGPLGGAPWALIDGHHWISHNAAFDAACFIVAMRRGQVPADIFPVEWDCTANLSVFLGGPRALDRAVSTFLGVNVDKTTRDEMKGKQWNEMSPEFQAKVKAYAMIDAEKCYQLWCNLHAQWPEIERRMSRRRMAMCLNGVATHAERLEEYIATLTTALWACEQQIPWSHEKDEKGKDIALMSPKALKAECVKRNIPPPLTTADKSEVFDAWMAKYEDKADFVRAVKNYRSINRTLEVLKKIRERTSDDGRLRYSTKYFGAHTGRPSGEAGLNPLNLTKRKFHFDDQHRVVKDESLAKYMVDLRGVLVPPPGKKFIIADLSQIEARVALWFADDVEQLKLIAQGMDVYEVHARRTMGYTDPRPLKEYVKAPDCPEKDKRLRDIAKVRVLGLGFGMGSARCVAYAKIAANLDLTPAQAKEIVNDFRYKNAGVVRQWNILDRAMRAHASKNDGTPFYIELPSWRKLGYFNVNGADDLQAQEEIGGPMKYWFGGKLFENLVQATARDLFEEGILRVEGAGYSVVLDVYDEIVCEVDLDVTVETIQALMNVTPDWAPGLPIGCDAHESDRYMKE